ncbi:protein PsiE [Thiohalospira halophila DSM 15071]|uniref:Protein PsiE n=1 Tax=Thiohalospira halophila DSM 15071 TaxID=1123397 RepID=A0A1I1N665_9GAMM|nr:phosphate-starvation-inducible PsiE family protein [Thiohalospira halophila]SFC92945.1 protein PsiE [Thiohalospira halophila DSM 15071]
MRRGKELGIRSIEWVEYVGLAIIAIATVVAIGQEVEVMVLAREVRLGDLLLLFIYLEVLTMVGLYVKSGQLPVRLPMYIAMVALARYLILDMKDLESWRMLAVAAAILFLAIAVLVIRYGHVRYPYDEQLDGTPRTREQEGTHGQR